MPTAPGRIQGLTHNTPALITTINEQHLAQNTNVPVPERGEANNPT